MSWQSLRLHLGVLLLALFSTAVQPQTQIEARNQIAPVRRISVGRQSLLKPVLAYIDSGRLAYGGDQKVVDSSTVGGTIAIFETASGSEIGKLEWSSPSALPGFQQAPRAFAVADGRFLLAESNRLRLFSSSLKELASRRLSVGSAATSYNDRLVLWDRWDIAGSADGNNVMAVWHDARSDRTEEHWLSLETLEDIDIEKNIDNSGHCCHSISREWLVYATASPGTDPILARKRGGAPHRLCKQCLGTNPILLDNQRIVIATFPSATLLEVGVDGSIRKRIAVGTKSQRVDQIATAGSGDILAVLVGPTNLGPEEYSVHVLDTKSGRLLKQFDFSGKVRQDRIDGSAISVGSPSIALSPEGNELAILNGSYLLIYSLDHLAPR